MKKIFVLFLLLLVVLNVYANEKYSFEKAEELTPLIEWRDYGPEAFEEAIDENKPIFLLLTAPSWCYWCQVYESEDYLFNPLMVEYLNENLIPVYVDADQRQDLTRQYLEGGWPSTTVLTPWRERLYGFSGPRPVENMLTNLQGAVQYVNTQSPSETDTEKYVKSDSFIPTLGQLQSLSNSFGGYILRTFDGENGGFGQGQKFPQGRSLDYSLDLYERTGEELWLNVVKVTLLNQYTDVNELQTNYNLFDPVEGGFHRYGTKVDWSPPHYEKMLYDNARLLKAYLHLREIENSPIANEVVTKTIEYIDNNWYDEKGGFWGNTDVHGEDAYYGESPRPLPKARVEETKYSTWNSEAIITYLEIDKDKARKSLDFFAKEMISDYGVYHYIKDGKKAVRGNLPDNAYMLLAFVEGYEVLKDKKYLETSKKIADYSLSNLYDWYGGGFFERNSPDKDLYAPGENIFYKKTSEENGIMALAMAKLYTLTGEIKYLNAAVKTLGVTIQNLGGLDRGYYSVIGAEYIVENNLLDDFNSNQDKIIEIENYQQANFWAEGTFTFSDEGVETLDSPVLILLLIAFFAGILSFLSPCTLPIIPAFVAYSIKASKKNIFGMTISFFLGLSLLFTLLGVFASFVGNFLQSVLNVFSQIAGVVLIIFGVFILLGKGFTGLQIKSSKPTSYLGSFIFGMVLGISWTPCVGPILVALLLMASTSSAFVGGLLLLIYSIGFALPLVWIAFYLKKKGKFWNFIKGKQWTIFGLKVHSTSLISGLIFIALGWLIFSGKLFIFNQYLGNLGLQKVIFKIEEFILGLI